MRTFFLAALLLLAYAVPAAAQTCLPHCTSGNHCVYVGSGGGPDAPTTCIPNVKSDGTVDTLVVTGAKPLGTASTASGPTFADIVNNGIVPFIDSYIIPLLYALAFLLFTFGVFRYFFTGGEEHREKGKAFVLWGMIGFVVLFGVWGIVRLLLSAIPGT